jgi:hypothetical protein
VALYPAQYSLGGGNVSITAQGDVAHQTVAGLADSHGELPMTWLYPRGYLDQGTGALGTALFGDVGSTTWWIDFSNFFPGAGALGGGNVTMIAGRDISNVDAVIPTNARMQAWLQKEFLLTRNADSAAFYQPWLRIVETNVAPFQTASTLASAMLRATAFTGDIALVGLAWSAGTINLSDANPRTGGANPRLLNVALCQLQKSPIIRSDATVVKMSSSVSNSFCGTMWMSQRPSRMPTPTAGTRARLNSSDWP